MRHKKIPVLFTAVAVFMMITASLSATTENQLLRILDEELNYNFEKLQHADSAELYFMSYQVLDERQINYSAQLGVLNREDDNHGRYLDIQTRVGSYAMDNTREIPGRGRGYSYGGSAELPLNNNEKGIRMKLWEETDQNFREAQKRFTNVLTGTAVKVEAEDQSDDFSREEPHVFIGDEVSLDFDPRLWSEKLKRYSEIFLNHPEIERSSVSLSATSRNNYYVNTEGSRIQDGQKYIRLTIYCASKAEDGMNLWRHEGFDAADFSRLPGDQKVIETIQTLIDELIALKQAPLAEPYSGPAILTGRASGVFFHEIFGHRMEGHRQKSESEGQTFTKKVGEQILPEFINVYSDPSVETYHGVDLRGYYRYDDEGIPGKRVTLVDHGVLRNFMMSRSPIENFPHSNGHGRKQRGHDPVSRQSNLIIESEKAVDFAQLKKMLIEECRRQEKPYGLIFYDISGGFTFTGRFMPQAFKVNPLIVYKVYVEDGREELIRGVDIVGTPLTSFSKIIMAADDPDIFNGTCGAESGSVPVSAISPSLLLSEIEVERAQKSQQRPPLLPSPLTKQQ
jgi:predicted Zn-dependent protease